MSIRSAINEYGGKHGVLEYLRENVQGMEEFLIPQVILSPGEIYSNSVSGKVLLTCEKWETKTVIIRTSEQSDWRGMVDTMPTERDVHISRIKEAVDWVRERCFDEALLKYAENEQNGYDPQKVTVSVAPQIPEPYGILTEHPNQPGVELLDIWSYDRSWANTETSDFLNGDLIDSGIRDEEKGSREKNVLKLTKLLRETGLFSDSESLQFEIGFHRDKPLLFQVRHFAERNYSDFQLGNTDGYTRIFGVTSPSGVVLPLVSGHREHAIADGDKRKEAYILNPNDVSDLLSLSEFPKYMQGYIPPNAPPLSHQNTRFVKICLERGGFAMLNIEADFELKDIYKGGGLARVISNGREYKISTSFD